jgi:hypothetical protein
VDAVRMGLVRLAAKPFQGICLRISWSLEVKVSIKKCSAGQGAGDTPGTMTVSFVADENYLRYSLKNSITVPIVE